MYYAKQVKPELTQNWLFHITKENEVRFNCDVYDENVIINGNMNFLSACPRNLKYLKKDIEYFNGDLRGYYESESNSLIECVYSYFKKSNGEKWSEEELQQWEKVSDLIDNYSKSNEEAAYLLALKLITGKEWRFITLQGLSQSDWVTGYVSEDIKQIDVQYIEYAYFGIGQEYNFYKSKKDMDNDEPVDSCFIFENWKVKEKLCEYIHCTPKQLKVYEENY